MSVSRTNLVPFVRYSATDNGMTLKSALEVTQSHIQWYHLKTWIWFLFAFDSNYDSVLYRFRDKVRYWSKIAIFFIPLHSTLPSGGHRRSIVTPLGTKQEVKVI